MNSEEWKSVVGYEGFYEVSSFGNVRSIPRSVGHNFGGLKKLSGTLLEISYLPGGYAIVSLSKDGVVSKGRVNRLVLQAFRGGNEPHACHEDNNPSNNRLDNLRWDTAKGNEADKIANGTTNRGERNHFSVLCEADVLSIRSMLKEGKTGRYLASKFGVAPTTITAIKKRRSWSYLEDVTA